MDLKSQEHIDIMNQFERDTRKHISACYRYEREARADWDHGRIYCHGPTNEAFITYRMGYAFGRVVYMHGGPNT